MTSRDAFRSTASNPVDQTLLVRIESSSSATVGCPSVSIRRCGGTLGSRSVHSSRWTTASATRQGRSSRRLVSSETPLSGAPTVMTATFSWVNVLSYHGARSGPADSGRSICGATEISLCVVLDLCAFGYTRRDTLTCAPKSALRTRPCRQGCRNRRRSGDVCCPSCAGRSATDRCRHPLSARMWEPSHTRETIRVRRARPVRPAGCGANWSKAPAFCQRSRHLQQVRPEPNRSSGGNSCQAMPLWRT